MKNQAQTHAQLREYNIALVLRYLKQHAPLSRPQLAKLTNLNKSTISSLTDELFSLNLIHEIGQSESSGSGRPALLLALNPQAGHVIGCEISLEFILVVITNFHGHIIWKEQLDLDVGIDQKTILNLLLQLINQAMVANQQFEERLLGVGITVPGTVNIDDGRVIFAPNLQWREVALRHLVQEHTGLLTVVENDANAATLAEHFFGVARDTHDFVLVLADVGLGGGFYLNGRLYRGVHGLAGEIGHMQLTRLGDRPCRCGKRGCWETEANKAAVISRVRNMLEIQRESIIPKLMTEQNSPLTFALIIEAAKADDKIALEAFAETGRSLGRGIANLINAFNPGLVVFSGRMSQAGAYLLPQLQETIAKTAVDEIQQQTPVVVSSLGDEAIVIGASTLVIQSILSNPRIVTQLGV